MTRLELKNHSVWRDLTEILENIDAHRLVQEHLELCDYKVCGYWDEQDKYYEIITLPRLLKTELISSSIGFTHKKRFLKLKFVFTVSGIDAMDKPSHNAQRIGELLLIYDENLKFVDENWLLDINSRFLDIKLPDT
ncbi:MAG: hypothetical protein V7K32_26910 [Nostoc sp.]|uniref:hypothetical protein n=1 Tax=Nostoc sp. TaxID=1180 RepID=UPI002FF76E74